jgi:membrane fusion protein (multidrug efflux system)
MTIPRHLLLSLLIAVCAACDDEPEQSPGSSRSPTPVAMWEAAPSLVEERIEAVATLSAYETVAVTAPVSGKVAAVHFDDGDRVAAGQLLVALEDAEARARVREVQAALEEARLQLQRLGSLGADISTRAAIDIARAGVAAGEARLAQAEATLADHQLRAPFAGTLGFRQVSKGALITPGTVVAELDDISQLKLDFTIPEVHLARLQVSDRVEAHTPAWPGQAFVATVRSIGSRVDPVTRAVTVRGLLDNSAGQLRPGMLMTVELMVGEEQAMVLPEQALIQRGPGSFVYTVDSESQARLQPVTIARRVEGGVIVSEGLTPGQLVVLRGQINLRPGAQVRPAREHPALAEGGAE